MSETNETRMDPTMEPPEGVTVPDDVLGLNHQDPVPHVPSPEDDDGPKGPSIDDEVGAIEDEDPPALEGDEGQFPIAGSIVELPECGDGEPKAEAEGDDEPHDEPDVDAEDVLDTAEPEPATEEQPTVATPSEGEQLTSQTEPEAQSEAQPEAQSEAQPEAQPVPQPEKKPASRARTGTRRSAKTEPAAEGQSAAAQPTGAKPAPEQSKMSAAGAAGMTRFEVLNDARMREMERAMAREERERFLSGWSALETAMHRHSIVHGVVSGVEVRQIASSTGPAVDLVLLAVMVDGGYKVLVPFDEFYQDNPVDMQTVNLETSEGRREYTRRRRALAEKLYELRIPLIITDMKMKEQDENGMYDYAVVGSRRRALTIQEMQTFGGNRRGAPLLHEGDMARATITAVSVYAVAVVLGGVDVRIPMRLLTYRYLLDARTRFHTGQELWVYVRQIKELENGHHTMVLDARMAELQAARMKQKLLPVGSSTLGVITSVRHVDPTPERPNGSLNITAYLKMYDMPAVVRGLPVSYLGREPISGDELRLVVRGFTRMGFVVANCHAFNGAPGLLDH